MLINEHALIIKDEISLEDLSYLIKKANLIGRNGRQIYRVYSEETGDGKHYFFECEPLSYRSGSSCGS